MGITEKAVLYSRSRFSRELSEIGATKPDGARLLREAPAAFGRLCVETHYSAVQQTNSPNQPPSGGCVLKHLENDSDPSAFKPAAFGRLCVETSPTCGDGSMADPAAFGRLCVETPFCKTAGTSFGPAAFGRLCVETYLDGFDEIPFVASRLRAAVC